MSTLMPREAASAEEPVELAWDLACYEGIAVMVGEAVTSHGTEACVIAHVVPDARPFALVTRAGGLIELWWSEFDTALTLVGVAHSLHECVEEARRTYDLLATVRRVEQL